MKKISTSIFIQSILLLIIFSGCNRAKPVTKQEALDFAKTIEASVAERNPNIFNDILAPEALKARIKSLSKGKLTDDMLSQVPAAIKKRRLGDDILQSVGKQGMYKLVKSYAKNDTQHLLFRMYGDGGINYHDFELTHSGNQVKAADMYIFMTGENISKSLADVFLQLNNYYGDVIDDSAAGFVVIVNKIKKYVAEGKYQDALTAYEDLPSSLKKDKMLQIYHVSITSNINIDLYTKALEEYQSLFPNDPSMYLLILDKHFLDKDYVKALEDINLLDKYINKDPFLDYYRGLINKSMDKDSTAITCFERLHKNIPDFSKGLLELIGGYARSGNMIKAKELLTVYKKNKKFNQSDLSFISILYPALSE